MRVVIPTWTVDEHKAGIRTYLTNLVDALRRQPEIELRLLCSPKSRALFAPTADPDELVDVRLVGGTPLRALSEQIAALGGSTRSGDVLLTPSNVGLVAARLPQVVVVQNALVLPSVRAQVPEADVGVGRRVYFRSLLGRSLRGAEQVVAVTTWVRDEILRNVDGIEPRRVRVVPEGVAPNPDPKPATDVASTPRILFVSTLFRYKGAELLLDALGRVRSDRPDLGWECRIVGRDPSGGALTDALRAQAAALGVDDRVTLAGASAPEGLVREYREATVLVYPSLVESFGLPPLEAMAAGLPVIASHAPGVAEVVGDAAVVVDPTRPEALADAIVRVLSSAPTRDALRSAGLRRAAELSWDHAAHELLPVLRDAVRGGPQPPSSAPTSSS
jgi:glycosyltransferase involved in cell wall biosynthesis